MSAYQTLGASILCKTLFYFQKNHLEDETLPIQMKVCPFVFPLAALQCHCEKWL